MEEKYQIARQRLLEMANNPNYVLDATEDQIGDISLSDINNLNFISDNLEDELVCVHVTNFLPKNSEIISTAIGRGMDSALEYKPNGVDSQYGYSHRHTVHTTLNFKVKSHEFGNFDDKKFIILTPFSSVDSKLCGFGTYDTYFLDKINLGSDSVILIREEDKDQFDLSSINSKIIYYRGNPDIAAEKAMIMMGYKPQVATSDAKFPSFSNEYNRNAYIEAMKKNPSGFHSQSLYKEIEHYGNIKDTILSNSRNMTHRDESGRIINEIDFNDVEYITYEELMEMYNVYLSRRYFEKNDKYSMFNFFIIFGIDLSTPNQIKLHSDIDTINNWLKLTRGNVDKELNINANNISENYDQESISMLESYFNNFLTIQENYMTMKQNEAVANALNKPISLLTKEEYQMILQSEEYQTEMNKINSAIEPDYVSITFKMNGIVIGNNNEDFQLFNQQDLASDRYQVLEDLDLINIVYDPDKSIKDNIIEIYDELGNIINYVNSFARQSVEDSGDKSR